MRYKGIVSSMIISLISMIGIFTLYWYKNPISLWNISLITGIAILIFYVNTKVYQKVEVSLRSGITYKRLAPFKIKKRYCLWMACSSLCVKVIISGVLGLNDATENEQRADEIFKNMAVIDSIINMGILAPIVEEIIFRGLLYMICSGMILMIFSQIKSMATKNKIDRITGLFFILISSVLFGIPHVIRVGDFENLALYVISGFVLSVLYVITKTLYVPILLHVLNNTVSTTDINIAYGIAILIASYSVGGLLLWFRKHGQRFEDTTTELKDEYQVLGLKRSTIAKRQLKAFFTYVKGQMVVKQAK